MIAFDKNVALQVFEDALCGTAMPYSSVQDPEHHDHAEMMEQLGWIRCAIAHSRIGTIISTQQVLPVGEGFFAWLREGAAR